MAVNLDAVLGGAGCIHKRTCNYREEHIAFVENANSCSPGVADISHMVQGASDLTMSTAGTLGVVDLYVGHVALS